MLTNGPSLPLPGAGDDGTPSGQTASWIGDAAVASDGGDFGPVCSDCGDGTCGVCDACRHRGTGIFDRGCCHDLWSDLHSHHRIWAQTDYLIWWAKGQNLPPLVTTSPVGTPQNQAGVLPESATTSILYGNEYVDKQSRNGARINFGYWLIDGEYLGIEGQYFQLAQQTSNFFSNTAQNPILARPFTNVDPSLGVPTQDSALVSYPGFSVGGVPGDLTGSINVATTSNIQGAGALFRGLIWVDFTSQRRLDWLAGYRYFRLGDSVEINDQFTVSSGLLNANFASLDIFRARNAFNGGDFGLKFQQYWNRTSFEFVGKIALGQNSERVYINGFNTVTTLGQTVTNVGGFLTQPTNIGKYNRDVFAILPEANFNLRYDVTCNLRLTAGYSFIYMNRVQRAGDAIDTTVNPTQIGGTLSGEARPAFVVHDTTFWVQGINAGFEYRW